MTEDKVKRITIATTICSVVLLCVLFIILAFQVINIIVKNNRLSDYEKEVAQLESEIDYASDELEHFKQEWKIQARARELGYKLPDDIDVG